VQTSNMAKDLNVYRSGPQGDAARTAKVPRTVTTATSGAKRQLPPLRLVVKVGRSQAR
jgi:hypothetical protein